MYYLNTNIQILLFKNTVNSAIYVDKSLLAEKILHVIGTENRYICITRPRRCCRIRENRLFSY